MPSTSRHSNANIERNDTLRKRARTYRNKFKGIHKHKITGSKINNVIKSSVKTRGANWLNPAKGRSLYLSEHELDYIDDYLNRLDNDETDDRSEIDNESENESENEEDDINDESNRKRSIKTAKYCSDYRKRLELTGAKIGKMIGETNNIGSKWLCSYNYPYPTILTSRQLDIIQNYIIRKEKEEKEEKKAERKEKKEDSNIDRLLRLYKENQLTENEFKVLISAKQN